MRQVVLFLALIFCTSLVAQKTRKVLFLGNSYTYYNNMPQMVADLASSTGDVLIHDQNTPGGSFLYDHTLSSTSLGKIQAGDWDYVVLQDQSQAPTLPEYQIGLTRQSAYKLDSIVSAHNLCAETLFYMTWGRKNGDSVFYRVYSGYTEATYEYMDSLLHARYLQFADTSQAEVSPVGRVWRHVRENYPNIELYQADESHPSLAGSYLAACTFYTAIFRKDPTLTSFNSSLDATTANQIKGAAKAIVYDSLMNWNIGKYDTLKPSSCPKISITETATEKAISVSPNPAREMVQITFGNHSNPNLVILDGTGKIIMKQKLTKERSTISISALPKGIYYLKFHGKGFLATQKLIKL